MTITLAPLLQRIIAAGGERAAARRHAEVTPEHLAWVLLREPEADALLRAMGADPQELRRELEEFIDLFEELPAAGYRAPRPDATLLRSFHRAALHAASAQRATIALTDLLAAMLREPGCYPMLLLHAAGLQPIDLFRFLAHRTTDYRLPASRAERLAVWLHNDEYTTMPFVVALLRQVFRIPHAEAQRYMLIVHHEGKAAVGEWPNGTALRLAREALRLAADNGFPLRLTTEDL